MPQSDINGNKQYLTSHPFRRVIVGTLLGCLLGVVLGAIEAWLTIFRIELYGGEVRGSFGYTLSRLILGGATGALMGALVGWGIGKTRKVQ
jgi:hypothetical protein